MLTVFNRAELLLTYDFARLCQVRDALAAAGIDYTCKVLDLTSPTLFAAGSRERMGNFAIDHDARVEYKLYVHRDQLDWARQFLR